MNLSDCITCDYNNDGGCEYWGCPYAEVKFCIVNTDKKKSREDE